MHDAMTGLVQLTLLIVGALFPIVNPLGSVPFFLSLTDGLSSETRSVLARKIAVNGFGLLIVSVLIGTHILAFFGISLPVVQVGGGVVVIAAGWRLLNRADDEGPLPTSVERLLPVTPRLLSPDFAVDRRAGSISVAIAVGANRPPG